MDFIVLFLDSNWKLCIKSFLKSLAQLNAIHVMLFGCLSVPGLLNAWIQEIQDEVGSTQVGGKTTSTQKLRKHIIYAWRMRVDKLG